jgi:protein TonB
MIRHTTSFTFSLLVHLLIGALLLFGFSEQKVQPPYENPSIRISLAQIKVQKPLQSTPKKQEIQKSEPIEPPKVLPQKSVPIPNKALPILKEEPKTAPSRPQAIQKEPEPLSQDEVFQEVAREHNIQETNQSAVIENKALLEQENVQHAKETQSDIYMQMHIKEIVALLREHLYYPRSARKRMIQGEVTVRFRLGKDARVHEIEVVASEHEVLSRAAVKTLQELEGKFPKPQEEIVLSVPIDFRLKE